MKTLSKFFGFLVAAVAATTVQAYSPASIVFDSPAETDRGSMFLGDGEIGALAWISADGTLHTVLQRTDSWDEAGRHIKVGQIDYATAAPVDAGSYRQELSLARGDFNATWKSGGKPVSVHYRVQWGDDHLAVCEIVGAPNASAKNVNWRFFPGGFMEKPAKDLEINFKYSSAKLASDVFTLAVSSDRALTGLPAGMFGWCHVNDNRTADKLFKFVDETQGLEGLGRPRMLNDRVFGAITRAEKSAEKTLFLTAVTCYWPCKGEADWRARTLGVLANQGWKLADEASKRAAHAAGWRTFWDHSHIELSPASTKVERKLVALPHNPKLPITFGANPRGGDRFSGTCTEAKLVIDGKTVFAGSPTVGVQFVPAPVSVKNTFTFSCTFKPAKLSANERLIDNITPGTGDGFLVDLLGDRVRVILGPQIFFHPAKLAVNAETKIEVEVSPYGDVVATVNGDRQKLADRRVDPVNDCRVANLAWAAQRYTTRLAAKGSIPLRFNGSLFTTRENGNPDFRRWGHGLWWQNCRLPYYPMFAAGDSELAEALFKTYAYDLLDFQMKRTRRHLGHGGAYFPECMQPWGDHFVGCYGVIPYKERKDKLQDAGWHKYEWVGQLELSLMMIYRYFYTEDGDWFKAKALPAIREYVRYFDEHYSLAANGRYDWFPAQAVETWWDCTAPMPEVAGLTRITELLLAMPQSLVGEADRALFAKIRSRIPELPTRKLDDGRIAYAPAARYEQNRNVEHPELYSVFPFRLCSFEKPNVALGRNAYDVHKPRHYCGWAQEELFACYLGMGEEAKKHFVHRVTTNSARGFRWPAYWGPNFDWRPDQCHGGNVQNIIQSMLLQFEGRKIFLAPAWTKDWNCSFKLHAPYQTTLEGRIENGQVKDLVVTPASRRADVVLCL